ncbi:nuclear transport factor 2 family protein [Muricauda sp. NFXS6]|uniref:nuclear transport factor 2 family protein n=1 Tax=Allomuricauda sp. NFXS6 TaxID=2819094 RepID=UPI0032DF64A3
MRKLIFTLCMLLAISANAQESKDNLKEKEAIQKCILNYIENFFENNFDEMNRSLHPRLAKRGLGQNEIMSEDFPPEKLKELMETKPPFSKKRQKNSVTDIKIFENMAMASLATGYPNLRWKEFIHLVKMDGQWQIINVFWDFEG